MKHQSDKSAAGGVSLPEAGSEAVCFVLVVADVQPLHRLLSGDEVEESPQGREIWVAEGLLKCHCSVCGRIALADVRANGHVWSLG